MPSTPNKDNTIFAVLLAAGVTGTIWCGMKYSWLDDVGRVIHAILGGG